MISGDVAGPPPWRVAMALVVVAALATALVLVARPDSTEPAAAPPAATAPPLSVSAEPVAEPSEDAPPARPDEVLSALDAALVAWGEFAATGDLSVLDATFADAGPQLAQLATEAPAIAADPPGPPPYAFDVVESGGATTEGDVAEVTATIRLSRPGEDARSFRWKVELHWDPALARWQLWTVTSLDG